ncbi:YciI family protein [Streptomyces sp. XM4193]|uniref:YciI family protein n=1 Tax=Streptomyces sp. XM4193 TaxID=2929782 RepID=UPI001FFB9BC8|nr:YciI family protein [Streptomyces sp. XM4193]MCK1798280.1 YciI family protein [Streptomyces sp. XM4193]
MLYMIQLLDDTETWEAEMSRLSGDDMGRMFAHMESVNEELKANGEWVEARGLGGPSAVLSVSATPGGEPRVTKGPQRAGGMILSGYWIVDLASRERAVELAARISACPGPGGEPYNTPVELHRLPEEPEQ